MNKRSREQASAEFRAARQEEPASMGAFAGPSSRRMVLKTGLGLAVVASGVGAWLDLHQRGSAFAAPPPPSKPTPGPTPPNAAIQWNNAALQAIRDVSPGPTIGSRALAIMHTCMYDAWAAYDKSALPTRPNGIRRQKAPKDVTQAVSYAAYNALMDLFPTDTAVFTSLMQSLGFDPTNTTTDTRHRQGSATSPRRRSSRTAITMVRTSSMATPIRPAMSRPTRPLRSMIPRNGSR